MPQQTDAGDRGHSLVDVVDCCSSGHFDDDEPTEEEDVAANLRQQLARRETQAIKGLKKFVLIFLACAAVGVGYGVYYYIRKNERSEFEEQFYDDANKVLASLGASLDNTLGDLDAFSVNLVSYAEATNQSWPFVTIPDFAVRAAKVRALSKAVVMIMYMNVVDEERTEWEHYTSENNHWVNRTYDVMEKDGFSTIPRDGVVWDVIHGWDELDLGYDNPTGTNRSGPYLPYWQSYPLIAYGPPYNWDLMSLSFTTPMDVVRETNKVVISEVYLIAEPGDVEKVAENEADAAWIAGFLGPDEEPMEPVSDLYYPILKGAAEFVRIFPEHEPSGAGLGGMLSMTFYWRDMIKDILPQGSNGVRVVFSSDCNPTFTYQINGPVPEFLGTIDGHEAEYDSLSVSSSLLELRKFAIQDSKYSGIPMTDQFCVQDVRVYPSSVMENDYRKAEAFILAVSAALIFVFTTAVFMFYDFWVRKRQRKVMSSAVHTNEIVASLFPSVVRDRMFDKAKSKNSIKHKKTKPPPNDLNHSESSSSLVQHNEDEQIADLYPSATVLFADIAGFTAWSSARGPPQVFSLLETLFGAFDKIADQRRVFKVETIGDCYVAVTGLPRPQPRHAVIMAKFANDCCIKFQMLTSDMEKLLGPGTADLALRVGLHSGPVTAGVLRGQKARFQLFGDTVNTAARMESNGKPHFIHVSQQTADLLNAAGKGDWLKQRDELITAKGKGKMQTYWVDVDSDAHSSVTGSVISDVSDLLVSSDESLGLEASARRMVDWNVGLLEDALKLLVAYRGSSPKATILNKTAPASVSAGAGMPLDEMKHVISFPPGDCDADDLDVEDLDTVVREQLRAFVTAVACSHSHNLFHNFERSSCVAMSCDKMTTALRHEAKVKLDPLSQFAMVFAGLIADIDHPSVSNEVLVDEASSVASRYASRCVAQQNAIEIAWGLLMDDAFEDLQRAIFPYPTDQLAFRQLVVHAIMTTDFLDAQLMIDREARWKEVSTGSANSDTMKTVIVDLICQSSSIAHRMQHWAVYEKWSKRHFDEQVQAFELGRTKQHPATTWVEEELEFLRTFAIPLGAKLREIEAFGKECQEYLTFSQQNHDELVSRGYDQVRAWEEERKAQRVREKRC